MQRHIMVLIAVVLLSAVVAVFAQSGESDVNQGQFAVLVASSLNAPVPPGGWTPNSAANFLSSQGLVPQSGAWVPAAQLTEGEMTYVLRLMGLNVFTAQPNASVTWAKARELVARYQDFFRTYQFVHRSTDKTTTTHIYTGVGGENGGAPAPASPSTP